jgi:23S rRNA (adenine2030-N6)-methyltransferase
MNYRHAYHAGNFADVFKHAILLAVVDHLRTKDKPFFVLDTHAGTGLYALDSAEALKTRESAQGVEKIIGAAADSPLLRAYREGVRAAPGNEGDVLRVYPGSPWFIRAMLRAQDRAMFNELHPQDAAALRANILPDRRVRVESRDGYACVRALLPPTVRRGLVLIDPPFESPTEWDDMVRALDEGLARFATGTYMLWYPIKSAQTVRDFHDRLRALPLPDTLAASFLLRPPVDPKGFNGTGVVVVNPPWTLAESLKVFLPEMVRMLAPETGRWSVEELSPSSR